MKRQARRTLGGNSGRMTPVKLSRTRLCFAVVVVQFVVFLPVFRLLSKISSSSKTSVRGVMQSGERKKTPLTSHVQKGTSMSSSPVRPDSDLPENRKLEALEKLVQQQLGGNLVRACRWFHRQNGTVIATMSSACQEKDASLVVYNPADHVDRLWCGQSLERKSLSPARLNTGSVSCLLSSPAYLHSKPPSRDASGMPPIRISSRENDNEPPHRGQGHRRANALEKFPCDVPCETRPSTGAVAKYLYIQDTNWKFTFSMEGSSYYHHLKVSPEAHLSNHFYATTSFNSEVPLPYFSWAEYNILTPPVEFDTAIHGASFIARNCGSLNDREKLVRDLQDYIRVDSLSSCMHNAEPPKGIDTSDKKKLQRQYLFHFAFENSCEDDYVTEKMWGTLESGTLPVYFGAPNIQQLVPPHSIISVHDFGNSSEQLGMYLRKVMANKTLYESYHEWRQRPLPVSFRFKYNFTHTHSTCRMCRWSYARKYGLGWDHEMQTIREVPRALELDIATGLIQQPFRESWQGSNDDTIPVEPLLANPRSANVLAWIRTVFEHDGVLDIQFERTRSGGLSHSVSYFLIQSGIDGMVVERRPGEFYWQDAHYRFTLLASWKVEMRAPEGHGTVSLIMNDKIPALARLRVIVEPVDMFHTTGKDAAYYFGQSLSDDFWQPIDILRKL